MDSRCTRKTSRVGGLNTILHLPTERFKIAQHSDSRELVRMVPKELPVIAQQQDLTGLPEHDQVTYDDLLLDLLGDREERWAAAQSREKVRQDPPGVAPGEGEDGPGVEEAPERALSVGDLQHITDAIHEKDAKIDKLQSLVTQLETQLIGTGTGNSTMDVFLDRTDPDGDEFQSASNVLQAYESVLDQCLSHISTSPHTQLHRHSILQIKEDALETAAEVSVCLPPSTPRRSQMRDQTTMTDVTGSDQSAAVSQHHVTHRHAYPRESDDAVLEHSRLRAQYHQLRCQYHNLHARFLCLQRSYLQSQYKADRFTHYYREEKLMNDAMNEMSALKLWAYVALGLVANVLLARVLKQFTGQ